ncbi:nucleotide disphospho-sugar-binding domain-containing protein [Rhodococcoides yunnanense]|uniref:DUF1205 domain-containing protein n=1 Tax=Rhodococcoides yunnanense TaxID=278209 RepID=A0ABU4BIA1_9NOCA|nr:nucleotide disphospho-sugar-binding domain-containing protein [Rhodococcus yunnanensis]MDV6263937.1 DUF1205 domain-containing protein [Rhodococcus yunnanensis]
MRILITVAPMAAHLYPSVPLAWALQSSGHEVRIASNSSLVEQINAVGIASVDLGEGASPSVPVTEEELDLYSAALAFEAGSDDDQLWRATRYYMVAAHKRYHPDGQGESELLDNLVSAAVGWRPDIVIWDPACPAGSVAARESGAVSARMLWGPDYPGWVRKRTREIEAVAPLSIDLENDPLSATLTPIFKRYGYRLCDEMVFGDITLDPLPLQLPRSDAIRQIPIRWVAYTGAGCIPTWLSQPPPRPRVCLSLGVTGRSLLNGSDPRITAVFDAVADMEVEVIATVNAEQLDVNAAIPGNVRILDYIPLAQVMPTCSAVIHHGGFGTFFAAALHRVPQMIVMDKLGSALNSARYLKERNAGVVLQSNGLNSTEVREQLSKLLTDPLLSDGTEEIYADITSRPTPSEIVPVLERIVAHRRSVTGLQQIAGRTAEDAMIR